MVTLRLLADRLLDPRPGGSRRYARNLGRQLVARAPEGCQVTALLPRTSVEQLQDVQDAIPGLLDVEQAPLRAEPLAAAWSHGLLTAAFGGGFIHAAGLRAPLRDHSLAYGIDQTVVTVQHTSALLHPELHTPAEHREARALLRRAHRYASGVVTPTNAVADELTGLYDFGDRLRVIGGAADPAIALPATEEQGDVIATRLGLPDDYVLTLASPEPRKGLAPLLRAFGLPQLAGVPLVVVGPPSHGEHSTQQLLADSGTDAGQVRRIGQVNDQDLAVTLQRASALVVPSLSAGFGLSVVEAFRFGTPVIHSDAPALREVALDAGHIVPLQDAAGYPQRLADAIAQVLGDVELSRRLRVAGRDRSHAYHWELTAEQVWAFHAEI